MRTRILVNVDENKNLWKESQKIFLALSLKKEKQIY